jgi:hypothetical protein
MTEFIEIPLTAEEEADRAKLHQEFLKQQEDYAAQEAVKETAYVKLKKLGLTEDEVKAVIGD